MRRRRVAFFLLAIPAILIAGLFLYNEIQYRKDLQGIFGVEASMGSPLYEYDSPRAFNGDGYTIAVYALPPGIREAFSSFTGELVDHVPVRPSFRSHWKTEGWTATPLGKRHEDFLEFALQYRSDAGDPVLSRVFMEMEGAIREPGGFYCFFYNDPGDHVGDIDFHFIDIRNKKLYIINHNT